MCLVLSGSVCHFDIALLRKFTNHNDFALTVRYRSFSFWYRATMTIVIDLLSLLFIASCFQLLPARHR